MLQLVDPPLVQPDQHSRPTPEQWIRFLKYASDIKVSPAPERFPLRCGSSQLRE